MTGQFADTLPSRAADLSPSDGDPGRRRLLKLVQLLLVVGARLERLQLPHDALLHRGQRDTQVGESRSARWCVRHTLLREGVGVNTWWSLVRESRSTS